MPRQDPIIQPSHQTLGRPTIMQNIDFAHDLYNRLPSLEEADRLFSDRSILSKLHPIFGERTDFAITLVHRHTSLLPGEIMVGRGDVTEPEQNPGNVYASSWLATGEVFEYSANFIPPLPADLLKRFKDAIDDAGIPRFGGIRILGICHIQDGFNRDEICVETTYGRKNVVKRVKVDSDPDQHQKPRTETCWVFDSSSPVAYAAQACCIGGSFHINACLVDATATAEKEVVDGVTYITTTTITTQHNIFSLSKKQWKTTITFPSDGKSQPIVVVKHEKCLDKAGHLPSEVGNDGL